LYLKPRLKLDYDLAEQLAGDMETEVGVTLEGVSKYFTPNTELPEVMTFLRTRKKFPAMLQCLLGDEKLPMKHGKNEMIPALAKTDEGCAMLLSHKKRSIRELVAAKLAITSWPTHAKRVRRMIVQTRCSGDLLRVPLKYYGAHTGRWSGSGGINLQNLGGKGRGKPIHPLISKVRNCLLAPDGHILAIVDSRQIEARKLAWIAGCDILLQGFANGEDIHQATSDRLGINSRPVARCVNFAVTYLGEEDTLMETARNSGIPITREQATDLRIRYFQTYTGIRDYVWSQREQITKYGWVTTLYGRVRKADPLRMQSPHSREAVIRELFNMPVQGTTVENVKKMMAKAAKYDLRIQVHDELVYDGACPPPSLLQGLAPFETPLDLKVGPSWG
ncbi:hypothetical protein LCGC14_2886670, partial [marine sediment metagenome]